MFANVVGYINIFYIYITLAGWWAMWANIEENIACYKYNKYMNDIVFHLSSSQLIAPPR